jgi:hypothetical protein
MSSHRGSSLGLIGAVLFVPCLLAGMARAQPPDDHGHRGPPRQPPPAAFEACKGKQVEDACQVTFGQRTLNGKCAAGPEGRLACRPEPPRELAKACEGKQENDSCSVQMGDHSFDGHCHKAHGDKLICRPAR